MLSSRFTLMNDAPRGIYLCDRDAIIYIVLLRYTSPSVSIVMCCTFYCICSFKLLSVLNQRSLFSQI